MHFVFYSGSGPASFFGILRFPRITSDSAEHKSELNHSRARLICSGILPNLESGQNPDGRTLKSTAYCAMCNKHTAGRLKITKKQVSMMAFCCYRAPPQAATPCYHAAVLPPLLPLLEQRQVCGGDSSSSSSSGGGGGGGGGSGSGGWGVGSGAILLLIVVVILLLLLTSTVGCCIAAPHLH